MLSPAAPVATRPLPAAVHHADSLDSSRPGLPSGFARLDAELPGGGWTLGGLNEILLERPGSLEWRLLTPLLARRPAKPVLLIAPPHRPHLPGLTAGPLLLIEPPTPQLRLWAIEQAIRSGDGGAVLAWLPEARDARPEQIRRLQAHALASSVPIFLFRPLAVAAQSSAAPLRVRLRAREPWQIEIHLIKRRGPAHEGWLALDATPAQLGPLLTPRMRSAKLPQRTSVPSHVVARAPSLVGH
ncbi:translesion DNA synthesis-associated protein ImuA [Burkholderiaceae bacterium UC74_6]